MSRTCRLAHVIAAVLAVAAPPPHRTYSRLKMLN